MEPISAYCTRTKYYREDDPLKLVQSKYYSDLEEAEKNMFSFTAPGDPWRWLEVAVIGVTLVKVDGEYQVLCPIPDDEIRF